MPIAPTSSEFKARYPAFTAVDGGVVDEVLAEAAGRVGDDWIQADQRPAMMAWTAHALTMEGFGSPSVAVGGSSMQVAGEVDAIQVGDTQVSFKGRTRSNIAVTAKDNPLFETPYGRRFWEIMRRNSPGVAVVV